MQMIGFGLVIFAGDNSDKAQLALKVTFLLVGIWWVGWAQIPFNRLPISSQKDRKTKKNVLSNGFHELKLVWDQMIHMPVLKRFLTAFFFYSMGVQTVMLVAIDFGIKILKLPNHNFNHFVLTTRKNTLLLLMHFHKKMNITSPSCDYPTKSKNISIPPISLNLLILSSKK